MAAHVIKLIFDPAPTKPHFCPARARIALTNYSRDKDDRVLLWGDCLTVAEVEEATRELKRDLDRILTEARRKFPQRQGGAGH